MAEGEDKRRASNPLGVDTDQLSSLSVDQILGSEVAVRMMLHFFRQLSDENVALKNESNTLKTYVDAYGKKQTYAKVGAWLLALSNIICGIAINLMTSGTRTPGAFMLAGGIAATLVGLYFSYREGG